MRISWRNKKRFSPSPRNELNNNFFILKNLQPNAGLGPGILTYCFDIAIFISSKQRTSGHRFSEFILPNFLTWSNIRMSG